MGQASINVDILAKVKGWQEELNKLKAAASKIDIGSSFGKQFAKQFSTLENQVNAMARNITSRLTSDSSIDTFTTKISNIDSNFERLGEHLGNISFDSLNPSYITAELKELNAELELARTNLNAKMGEGFNDAIQKSSALEIALKRLGQDPKTISMGDAFKVLTDSMVELEGKINDSTAALEELRQKKKELQAEQLELNNKPLAKVEDLSVKVNELIGSQADYGLKQVNTAAIREYIANLKSSLQTIGVDLTDETNKINQAFAALAGSSTQQEVRNNLLNLQKILKEDGELKSSDLTNIGFGNINTKVNEFVTNNLAILNDARNRLQESIRQLYPEADAAKLAENFVNAVKSGNWEEGKQALEEKLGEYKTAIDGRKSEIETSLKEITDLINNTRSDMQAKQYTQGVTREALEKDWPELVRQLTEQNKNLDDRVKKLEAELAEKMGGMVAGVKATGVDTMAKAKSSLIENANAAKVYKTELEQVQAREQMIGKIQGVVQRWFSIYAAVRMVSNAIRSIISTIKELDETITEIAIVTKMDQTQLWGQMDTYTSMARAYAASISGVYKVSQLYYQQGLQTSDVMALTEQTLKMARISGLDYAQATDYMTNAVRSFKLEMTDAQSVVDTYSAIAAKSATSVTELATAMSKTASSAQSVGASLQSTTAMMAVMIEATRESPENIGSAMKSIISRYGELKENKTGIDAEGEEYNLNKVDKALQTVGLSIHDVNGEFRDFDDVIMELAEKWDTIDKNTQRYIATIMAGNRQQSRFLALVSSYDRLKELSAEAANSEDASQLQFLKTLDSIAAKTQQLQTSLQSLYVDIGLESLYKGALDWLNNIAITLSNLPDLFGLPIPAIIKLGTTFATVANIVVTTFTLLKTRVQARMTAITKDSTTQINSINESSTNIRKQQENSVTENFKAQSEIRVQTFINELNRMQAAYNAMRAANSGMGVLPAGVSQKVLTAGETVETVTPSNTTPTSTTFVKKGITKGYAIGGLVASIAGTILSGVADNFDEKTQSNRTTKAILTGGSNLLQGAGLGMSIGGLKGALIGGALGAIKGLVEAIGIAVESTEEKLQNLDDALKDATNTRIKSEDDLKTLKDYKTRYEELYKARNDSNDAYKEYINLCNEIANTYPTLISGMDEEGNYVVDLTTNYENLLKAKQAVYNADFIKEGVQTIKNYSDKDYLNQLFNIEDVGTYDPNGSIANMFKFDKVAGAITHYFSSLSADEWNESLATILPAALNEASLANMTSGAEWDKIIGKGIFTGNGSRNGFNLGTAEGTDRFIRDNNINIREGQYTWLTAEDIVKYVMPAVMQKTGEMLDEGQGLDAVNEYFQEYFGSNFVLNNDIFGNLYRNRSTAETRDTYLNDVIKSLNISATRNAINELDLDTDTLEFKYYTNQIQEQWEAYTEELPEGANLSDAWQTFALSIKSNITTLSNTLDLYSGLSDKNKETINELYTNADSYSIDDYESLTADMVLSDELSELLDEQFLDLYNKKVKKFNEQIKQLNDSEEVDINLQQLSARWKESFGVKFWDGIISNFANTVNNEGLQGFEKDTIIDDLVEIYDAAADIIDPQEKRKFMELLQNTDLNTLTGIYSLFEQIESLGINVGHSEVIEKLEQLTNDIKVNLPIEFSSFTDSVVGQFKDFESALSSASKGMDISEAVKFAEKLDTNLKDEDFIFKEGQYFFKNADRIKEAYIQYNQDLYDKLNEQFDNQYNLLESSLSDDDITFLDDMVAWGADDAFTGIEDLQAQYHIDEKQATQLLDWYNTYLEGYTKALDSGEIESNTEFSDYVLEQITSSKKTLEEAIEEYGQYQVNAALIQNGYLLEFFESIGVEYPTEGLSDLIYGEWEDLPEEIQPYFQALWDLVKGSATDVFDTAIKVLEDGEPQLIEVTAANREFLENLLGETLNGIDKVLIESLNPDDIKEAIKSAPLSDKQKAKYLSTIFEEEHKNIIDPLSNILSKDGVAYSDAQAFAESLGKSAADAETVMEEYGFKLNSITGKYEAGAETYDKIRERIAELASEPSANMETINKLYADLDELQVQNKRKTSAEAFKNIISNYKNISSDMIAALGTALEIPYNSVKELFLTDNGDGTFSLDTSKIEALLTLGKETLGDTLYNNLLEEVAQYYDDILTSISSTTGFVTNGTKKVGDIQKFITDYNKRKPEANISMADAFAWDEILGAWTLKPEYLNSYLISQGEELARAGFNEEYIEQYLTNEIQEIKNNVDISSFLSAENNQFDTTARRTLEKSMKAALTVSTDFSEEIINAQVESSITALETGGQAAVDVVKEWAVRQNRAATASEIEDAFYHAMKELSDAMESLKNITIGQITTGKLREELAKVGMVDANGVVTSVREMVAVYANIYQEMKVTAGKTTADLNTAFAEMLTAQDQTRIDAKEALENASGMTYDAFANLLTSYNLSFEDVLAEARTYGIQTTGFGEIRIIDFKQFASMMGWDINSPEYAETYNNWVNSMTELQNQPIKLMQNATEQLSGILEAKPNQRMNVSYLERTFNLIGEDLGAIVGKYGAELHNGILTVSENTDIPKLVAEIANVAAEAGAIIPEELAKLADAVKETLASIVSLLSGGLSGNLNNAQKQQLSEWANLHGIEKLTFTETAEGFKLANGSAIELVQKVRELDALQGEVAFGHLKDNLIATEDIFATVTSQAADLADLQAFVDYEKFKKEIIQNSNKVELFDELQAKGNVQNLYNRKRINNADGSYSTLLTTTLDSRNFETDVPWIMNITPITEDGKILSEEELSNYVKELIEGTDGKLESVMKADKEGLSLILEMADGANTDMDNLAESMSKRAYLLHQISEAYEAVKAGETYDDTKIQQYEEELRLNQEILALRSTSQDSTFSFMSNKIPGAQNNPINYMENWFSAMSTIDDSVKSGWMDYSNFYNIITAMGELSKITGDAIPIGTDIAVNSENVAQLIEQAAGYMKIDASDGKYKINLSGLSQMGIDFAAAGVDMKGNVTEGIHDYAQAQVEMLDGMIQVLETIVAMQKLGEITGDDNKIDMTDLFPEFNMDDENEKHIMNNEKAIKWAEELLSSQNKDIIEALQNIKINGQSLHDLLTDAITEGKGLNEENARLLSIALNSFYQSYANGEYDLENLYESLKQNLISNGFEGTFKLGDQEITITQGKTIIKTKEGKFVGEDGKEHDTLAEAYIASQKYWVEGAQKQAQKGVITLNENNEGTIQLNTGKIGFSITDKGQIKIGQELYDSLDAYYSTILGDLTLEEFKINNNLKIVPKFDVENGLTPDQAAQLKEAGIKTAADLQAAWDNDQSENHVHFKAKYDIDLEGTNLNESGTLATKINEQLADVSKQVNIEVNDNGTTKAVQDAIDELKANPVIVEVTDNGTIKDVQQDIYNIKGTTVYATIKEKRVPSETTDGSIFASDEEPTHAATGNVGLAKGTLMGELGPELVVSNGRYFVAGQNGPEMVDLADDAIVFNHLQTQSLLQRGMSSTRGKAVTNERKAVAYAKGSIHGGPAMASAEAALGALRELRAQWKSILDLTAEDLTKKAGGGGGGGNKDAAFLKELERWYNWLQEIATLEEKINYEEAKRSKIQSEFNRNGYEYYKSQRDTLKYLENEMAVQRDLLKEQQAYFDKRRQELNTQSAFSSLYGFDENGQIKYKSAEFQRMAEMFGSDSATNKPYHEIKEQYDWLIERGFGYAMEYNDSGEKIDAKDAEGMKQALDAFWKKIESDQNEMQDLHDSINDLQTNLLKEEEEQNKILKEMEDNQIALENRVLKAMEDAAKREIDELGKQKDAYKESTDALLNGLTEQLDKERQMYEKSNSDTELEKKRRRLAILQRSGGSASEISSLQSEIDNDTRDQYFEKQQEQIDAIQEAADNQIEKLEEQIELLNETLEYQKEHGLIWEKVYEIMAQTPEEITNYITSHDSEFWGKSITNFGQETRQIKFEAEQWKAFTEEGILGGVEGLLEEIANEVVEDRKKQAEEKKKQEAATTTPTETTSSSGSGGGSGSGGNNKNTTPVNTNLGKGPGKVASAHFKFNGKDYTIDGNGYSSSDKLKQAAQDKIDSLIVPGANAYGNKMARDAAKRSIKIYSRGGMVDEDQYAFVHAKEGVLTASQTSILRNEILGNSPDSALNILRDIRAAWIDSSNGLSSINNDSSSIVIEHAEVNMKVEKLANGYDAAKAGDDVMREILNIARKTSAQNRVGR